jgi:cytochrome c553
MAFRIAQIAVVPAFAALLVGSFAPAPARADAAPAAGDAKHGARIAYTCFGCHGIPDYRNAYPDYHVPKLGGQHAGYLAAALAEYRSGDRPHPTMHGQASSLSAADAGDIAAFFATPTPAVGGKPVGTAPAAAQICASCHGADGVGITSDYPTLAGQHADYLEQALKAYRKGTRKNAIMNGFAATLKDEDIHALAQYFAQQQPGLATPQPPSGPQAP